MTGIVFPGSSGEHTLGGGFEEGGRGEKEEGGKVSAQCKALRLFC